MGFGGQARRSCGSVVSLVCALAVLTQCHALAAEPVAKDRQADAAAWRSSTRIVVKFAAGVVANPQPLAEPQPLPGPANPTGRPRPIEAYVPVEILPVSVRTVCHRFGVQSVRRVFPFEFRHKDLAAKYGLDRTFILEVPMGTDTVAAAAAFAASGADVERAEVDGVGGTAQLFPDDPSFDLQYGMHNGADTDINAPEAWDIHTGNPGTVRVAVLDSGMFPHEEFVDRMIPGINTNNSETPNDTSDQCLGGHGTHVTGVVAATGNNGIGVAGMTWGATIVPVRVLNGCFGFEADLATGILWATELDPPADICNMSLQFCGGISVLEDAVNFAYDLGVLLVAASGNSNGCGANVVAAPARFTNCIAVAATNEAGFRASFSNTGSQVELTAPGDKIHSTFAANLYGLLSGTSMATPHVSGLAALMKSFVPNLKNGDIRNLLIASAVDLGTEGRDTLYGFGLIDAEAALSLVTPLNIVSSVPPDGAIDARQPHELDGSEPAGWISVEMTFDGLVSVLQPGDFDVSKVGGVAAAPAIASIDSVNQTTVTITFDAPLEVLSWTTITHIASGTSVRLGYLPADVNGDGVASSVDIIGLVDFLNGIGPDLENWSVDIDRTDEANVADIVRLVDLLSGASEFDEFVNQALPE